MPRLTPLQRIARMTTLLPNGCAVYTGSGPDGYGTIGVQGRSWLVHRYAYELLVAPIPKGLQMDHLCRNRKCWNPQHLEPVTQTENARRGFWALKTHCNRGHVYDEANTIINANGHRVCRACITIREAKYRAQRQVAA